MSYFKLAIEKPQRFFRIFSYSLHAPEIDYLTTLGLERAVFILEKSIHLSRADQWHIIESLKEKIIEDKISVTMGD